MIVSHKHKFAYMAPPKTGTTSMEDHLTTHYEGVKWEYQETPRANGGIDRHGMGLKEEWSDYFVFATVRNPYTHELSKWDYFRRMCWAQHILKECESLYVILKQHEEYEPPPNCVKFKLNAYVRMEHMQKDFEKLPFAKKIKIKHLNKYSLAKPFNRTKTKPYPTYTEETIEIIKTKRKMDFETFGYSTEPPSNVITSPVVSLA